jgi:phenylacetic acid degradation operon negative regulatory protein
MTDSPNTWFEKTVAQLNDPSNQRVWSVIVSLFGDMGQDPADRIGGSTLTQIISPIGIKPEAIRVALHRLRKDGWIDSARSGRNSVHFLTASGRAQSAQAATRIYDRKPDIPDKWHVLLAEDGAGQQTLDEVLLTDTHVAIGRHCALGHGSLPPHCDDLLAIDAHGFRVPDWLKRRVFPADLVAACTTLLNDLEQLGPVPGTLTPQQVATVRTLIVHRWRRVVLRHLDLPLSFHPTDWPGEACRDRVFAVLECLPKPNLSKLQD